MGTIWAISASLTRSSSRAQQGTRRALPWTGNSIFCTKKRGKELNYLHIHFPEIWGVKTLPLLNLRFQTACERDRRMKIYGYKCTVTANVDSS